MMSEKLRHMELLTEEKKAELAAGIGSFSEASESERDFKTDKPRR